MPDILDTLSKRIEALEQRIRIANSGVPKHRLCFDLGDPEDPTIETQKKEFLTQHNLKDEHELHEAGGHFVEVRLPWLRGERYVGNQMSVEEYKAAGQHENTDQTPYETPYTTPETNAGAEPCSPTKGEE